MAKHVSFHGFYGGKQGYDTVWRYENFINHLIGKKLETMKNLNNKTKQMARKEKKRKVMMRKKKKNEDEVVKEEEEDECWDLSQQLFAMCVPCFLAGYGPQRCIFFSEKWY